MSNIIDAYCVYCSAQEIKRSTEASKEMLSKRSYVNRKRYLFITRNITEHLPSAYLTMISWLNRLNWFYQYYHIIHASPFFRDNGITIQILTYQLYCEGFMFLSVLFVLFVYLLIPIENYIFLSRIMAILFNFVVFVVQPMFYLNGDINFRNRVLQQGLWRALKKELFPSYVQIQPVFP